jgi:hypothetical protein
MAMSKRVGDSEILDDFLAIAGPSQGFAPVGSRPGRVVPFPCPANRRKRRRFLPVGRLGLTQINLIWPLGFFHKIDLIVRFRLAGVRIRGHEEG